MPDLTLRSFEPPATVAIYAILGLGLIALGAHVNRNTRILLKAIEMVERR